VAIIYFPNQWEDAKMIMLSKPAETYEDPHWILGQ